jgi:hypothetical protein
LLIISINDNAAKLVYVADLDKVGDRDILSPYTPSLWTGLQILTVLCIFLSDSFIVVSLPITDL